MPSAPADVFVADLSSQQEVHRLTGGVLQTLDRLDVLINNVGGFWNTRRRTVDGVDYTFALNHLAAFLHQPLLERLQESAPARVVTVSSGAQAIGRMDFADLQAKHAYSGQRALAGTGVTANALHPGVVATAFGAEDPGRMQAFLMPLVQRWLKTPEQGARTSIHLASAPELKNVTGQYFANSRAKKSSKRSYSKADADLLWDVSAALVGLAPDSERSTNLK